MPSPTMQGVDALAFIPVGAHTQNSSLSSAVTLVTGSTDKTGAGKLLIQALTQNIRITLDGTAPTSSKGFRIIAGDPAVLIPLSPATTVKVIEETASASIEYQLGY